MKLLTSSLYSSPSSSSTLSLDPSLSHAKSAAAGFLSAIFRRFLCSRGIKELDSMSEMSAKVQELKTKQNTQSTITTTTTITPSLVGRLMGLEPMGERKTSTTTTVEATPSSSLSRSKSMNSVDNLGEHKKRMEGLHKRAKSSSSSLCEVPTFHLVENENFLVLNFESGCDGGEFRSKGRRRKEKGLKERGELKKNKREEVHDNEKGTLSDMSCTNIGNDCEHKLQFSNTLTLFMACSEKEYVDSEKTRFSHHEKSKEVTNGGKMKRRKKGTMCYAEKKKDTECSSEDSSPVSIFDFEREALGTEVDSFGVDTSWRRKLSPELENDQLYVLHCDDNNLMVEERDVKAIEDNKHKGSEKKEKYSQDCADIWVEICRLVDEELGSIKLDEGLRKQCNFESVCADFESEIFYYLLNELIDQLVGDPFKALRLQNFVKQEN